MTKSEYAGLLRDERWNTVRKKVLHRDDYTCRHCKAKNVRLNVHHKIYIVDTLPWEVPTRFLVSLCDKCHAKAHENRPISSFIKQGLPQTKGIKRPKPAPRKQGKSVKWIPGVGLVATKHNRKRNK